MELRGEVRGGKEQGRVDGKWGGGERGGGGDGEGRVSINVVTSCVQEGWMTRHNGV